MINRWRQSLLATVAVSATAWAVAMQFSGDEPIPENRERVIFWHFWGGQDRQTVRNIVARFHASQDEFWVDEIAVPGQNLDMKFFMSLAGGDAPDVLNQDDQIIAQWADRGVILPLRELVDNEAEYAELLKWLNPAARKIGTADDELFALCNAIDIRALFYRKSALGDAAPPQSIAELDRIAKRTNRDERSLWYLPDDRRLWAWGIAFGGEFFDEATGRVTANHPKIVAALEWMVSYSEHLGVDRIRAFRSTNREAGAGSMLLDGRYGLIMDGQWRVAELDAADGFDYGVVPLPSPPDGRPRAGWVNGNFFVVPRGCRQKRGAWAFMKFWSGFGGNERAAAVTAASGGWIPASRHVVDRPEFQAYLEAHPKFRVFVELADSPNQHPTPAVPVQPYFYERINLAVEEAMVLRKTPQAALDDATRDIQARLDARGR